MKERKKRKWKEIFVREGARGIRPVVSLIFPSAQGSWEILNWVGAAFSGERKKKEKNNNNNN